MQKLFELSSLYFSLPTPKFKRYLYSKIGLNSKNGCLKSISNYGILGVNKGLFTNGCKKVLKYV